MSTVINKKQSSKLAKVVSETTDIQDSTPPPAQFYPKAVNKLLGELNQFCEVLWEPSSEKISLEKAHPMMNTMNAIMDEESFYYEESDS
jgi:hypothetical protein